MGKKIDITDEKKMVALSDGTERTIFIEFEASPGFWRREGRTTRWVRGKRK